MDLRSVDPVTFRVQPSSRTVTGDLITWNQVANPDGRRYRFLPGSLHWSSPNRVKLNREHVQGDLVGVATALAETATGITGTFRIARTPEGDAVLSLAEDGVLDGFSVEVTFDDGGAGPDPQDPGVTLVRRAKLAGVALTGRPAFDAARLTSVAASTRDTRLEIRLNADEAVGVRAAADRAGVSMAEVVRSGLRAYTTPRPVYALGAQPQGFSLIRDLWVERHPAEGDSYAARDRLAAHRQYEREFQAQFATATTVTDPEIVPAGYRPLIASIEADRPLYAAASKGNLTDATPFTLPAILSEAAIDSGAAVVAEGVAPTEGTLAFSPATVTPGGVRGVFKVTRELFDSSNPAVDAIAFTAMREDYNRDTEKQIFTELNTVQAGTITAGFVPSGAAARTSAGAALPADLRKTILAFVDHRKTKARSVVASSRPAVAEALEALDMQAFALRDVTVELSPWITGTAAGDGDVFVTGRGDLWAWSSPLLEFSYGERSGPAMVELAVYGYFATRLIKAAGLAAIRHT